MAKSKLFPVTYLTLIFNFYIINAQDKLPNLVGSYQVGHQQLSWIDYSRKENITDIHNDFRKIHADVWFPTQTSINTANQKYIDNRVLNQFVKELDSTIDIEVFEKIKTNFIDSPLIADRDKSKPVILFSPGGNVPVQLYTSIYEYFASKGYIIFAFSHAHANPYIDGKGFFIGHSEEFYQAQWNTGIQQEWNKLLNTVTNARSIQNLNNIQDFFKAFPATENIRRRTNDIHFLIDKLHKLNETPSSFFCNQLDFNQIYGLGHSFGGAVLGQFATENSEIKAVVNMDGWQFGDVASRKLKSPLLWIQGDYNVDIDFNDIVYLNNPNSVYKLTLPNTKHFSFSDLVFFLNNENKDLIGEINKKTFYRILCELIEGFFIASSEKHSKFLYSIRNYNKIDKLINNLSKEAQSLYYYGKSQSEYIAGNFGQSEEFCKKALQQNRQNHEAKMFLGQVLRIQGKYEDAIEIYQSLINSSNDKNQLMFYKQWVIATLVLFKKYDSALDRVENLISEDLNPKTLLGQRAWIHAKKGNLDKALDLYKIYGSDAAFAWALALNKDFDKAQLIVSDLVKNTPTEWWEFWDIALVYLANPQKADNAIFWLRKAIETLKRNGDYLELINLGWRMSIEDDYDLLEHDSRFKNLITLTGYNR